MFNGKNTNQHQDVTRCLWVAKMPSSHIQKLPLSSPCPKVLGFDFVISNAKSFDKTISLHATPCFVAPASALCAVSDKTLRNRDYRGLFLYAAPRQFELLSSEHFFSDKNNSIHSKSIARALYQLWPEQKSNTFSQLVQWYASLRGALATFSSTNYLTVISRDTQWCGNKQRSLFIDTQYRHEVDNNFYYLKMPDHLPIEFRKMIQDAWLTLQKLEKNCTIRGQWRLACQHLATVYQSTIITRSSKPSKKSTSTYVELDYTPVKRQVGSRPLIERIPKKNNEKPINIYKSVSLLA